jgi:hypothetical protein
LEDDEVRLEWCEEERLECREEVAEPGEGGASEAGSLRAKKAREGEGSAAGSERGGGE